MKGVVDILKDLVRIPSASSLSNRAVIAYAQSALHQAGWNTTQSALSESSGAEKINLIAAPPGQRSEEPTVELAFLCHTDTVPPASDWTAALEPFVQDSVLYGCGACDVKGFLACLLAAMSEPPNAGYRDALRIVLTADEEIGCLGSHRLLAGGLIRPRTLIIGEPTSLHPARAGKGYCLGEMTIFGSEAHSAHPGRGRSAIYDAARVIQAIERFAEQIAKEVNPFFDPPYTTINIGTIRGGTAKNIVPAQCSFLVEWRPIPDQCPEYVPDGIRRLLEEIKNTAAAFQYNFTVQRQQHGFETPAASDLVLAMEHLTDKQPISIPFGSEASVFASIAEEIVVFGPGDMRTAHSPRECVPISELEQAVSCIKSLMRRDIQI
jgi:acetylornithine deacetylase